MLNGCIKGTHPPVVQITVYPCGFLMCCIKQGAYELLKKTKINFKQF